MPPSQVSRPSGNNAATAPTIHPTQVFDDQTLKDFMAELDKDPGTVVLSPNERSHLRIILEPGYVVPKENVIGGEKPKQEWWRENTQFWQDKKNYSLNSQNQVVRNPENDFNERIVACTYNTGQYIINKHIELGHTGIGKTFLSL